MAKISQSDNYAANFGYCLRSSSIFYVPPKPVNTSIVVSNYWSFKNNTPSGVTIHEIDKNLDTGNIIFRKKIMFKNIKNLTLKKSYWILRKEIQKLFILNYKKILNYSYKSFKSRGKGSYHKKNDLPKNISWDFKVTEL